MLFSYGLVPLYTSIFSPFLTVPFFIGVHLDSTPDRSTYEPTGFVDSFTPMVPDYRSSDYTPHLLQKCTDVWKAQLRHHFLCYGIASLIMEPDHMAGLFPKQHFVWQLLKQDLKLDKNATLNQLLDARHRHFHRIGECIAHLDSVFSAASSPSVGSITEFLDQASPSTDSTIT